MNKYRFCVFILFALTIRQQSLRADALPSTPPPATETIPSDQPKMLRVVYRIDDLTTPERVVERIRKSIQPKSWQQAVGSGGEATIQYFPADRSLVISNTINAHDAISALLRSLRQFSQGQVEVEIQTISVVDTTWKKAAEPKRLEPIKDIKPNGTQRFMWVDQKGRDDLIDFLLTDDRTEIMQGSKLKMYNGQTATLNTTEERTLCVGVATRKSGDKTISTPQIEKRGLGVRANVQATISADRRQVKLDISAKRTMSESPSQFPVAMRIPILDMFGGSPQNPDVPLRYIHHWSNSMFSMQQSVNLWDGATMVAVIGLEPRTIMNASIEQRSTEKLTEERRVIVFLATPRIVIHDEIEREILGVGTAKRWAKEREKETSGTYSTGGKMTPRQYALQAGYDLTVLNAVTLSGGPIVNGGFDPNVGKKAAAESNDASIGHVLVLRREKDGLTQRIVDLDRALKNSAYDLVVRDGDVLILQEPSKSAGKENAREEPHVYYTGGIGTPRQHTLPRDRELRVTQAIAGKLKSAGPDDPVPGEVLIIRRTQSGEQTQLLVNLNRALFDPAQDVVVQNGDFLVLQETPADMMARMSRSSGRDGTNVRVAPALPARDLSEPSEPRQPIRRR